MTLRQYFATIDLMYELTYILNPNLSEADVAAQADKTRGFINELGGTIKNERLWEKRRLAYEIKKQGYGFYVTSEFEMEPEKIVELDSKLRIEPQILRHLLLSKEIIKETPRRAPRPKIIKEKPGFPELKSEPETAKEKVKIEEIDKRLEELLEE